MLLKIAVFSTLLFYSSTGLYLRYPKKRLTWQVWEKFLPEKNKTFYIKRIAKRVWDRKNLHAI